MELVPNKYEDCSILFSNQNVAKQFYLPSDISFQQAKMTCRVALMRLIKYFDCQLPENINIKLLRELVIYIGGDVNNQNSAAWQEMQQMKTLDDRTDCLLMRKGELGTPDNEVFIFNVERYNVLSQQPLYKTAIEYLITYFSDDVILKCLNTKQYTPKQSRIKAKLYADDLICNTDTHSSATDKIDFKRAKYEDCSRMFSSTVPYRLVDIPDITTLSVEIVCRAALMHVMEYFMKSEKYDLPDYIDLIKLRNLVMFLGGAVNEHTVAVWQGCTDYLLWRAESESSVLSFNVENYKELSKQPCYELPLHHFRRKISDVLIRRYIVVVLTESDDD